MIIFFRGVVITVRLCVRASVHTEVRVLQYCESTCVDTGG